LHGYTFLAMSAFAASYVRNGSGAVKSLTIPIGGSRRQLLSLGVAEEISRERPFAPAPPKGGVRWMRGDAVE